MPGAVNTAVTLVKRGVELDLLEAQSGPQSEYLAGLISSQSLRGSARVARVVCLREPLDALQEDDCVPGKFAEVAGQVCGWIGNLAGADGGVGASGKRDGEGDPGVGAF